MKRQKKLNLLPQSVKNRYLNKALAQALVVVCGLGILILGMPYTKILLLHYEIGSLQSKNIAYTKEKTELETLQTKIAGHKKLLSSYENGYFPFIRLIHDLENLRLPEITILSVDSADRLSTISDKTGTPEKSQKIDETKPKEQIAGKTAQKVPEKSKAPQNTSTPAPEKPVQPTYKKDLANEKLTIRGYSTSPESLSKFIYDIAHLPYIKEANITAIEEHWVDGILVNVFEFAVIGGDAS